MSLLKKRIEQSAYCSIRVQNEVIRMLFKKYIKNRLDEAEFEYKNLDFSFSKYKDTNKVKVTFNDAILNRIFFDKYAEPFLGVEDMDCGSLLLAQCIAEEFDYTFSEVSIHIESEDFSFMYIEIPTEILKANN